MVSARASERTLLGVSALIFAACAAATIAWSMQGMAGMSMDGSRTMSTAWMPMPGQAWPGTAVSFLGMWNVMMVAMMMPSLMPMLLHYRRALADAGNTRLGFLIALAGMGYFFVWTVFGIATFLLGAAVAAVEPALARAAPVAVGVAVLAAGAFQFTAWKAHHLACCRRGSMPSRALSPAAGRAWRHGVRLGFHCGCCCANLMAILLVVGVMDLRAMAIVAAVITVERLTPAGERFARAIGAAVVVVGLLMTARAAGLG